MRSCSSSLRGNPNGLKKTEISVPDNEGSADELKARITRHIGKAFDPEETVSELTREANVTNRPVA